MEINLGTRAGPEKRLRSGKRKRAGENQDRLAVRELGDDKVLLAVMDGISNDPMGGGVANFLQYRFLSFDIKKNPLSAISATLLVLFIKKLQSEMDATSDDKDWQRSGCTLVVAVVDQGSGEGCLAWMGDSPAFITKRDPSDGTELLTKAHAAPDRSLTSRFTVDTTLPVGTTTFRLESGDILSLVTDGVTDEADGLSFLDGVLRNHTFKDVPRILLSRKAIGPHGDDATFIVARYT